MRGSGWTLPIIGLLLWIGAVLWPAVSAIGAIASTGSRGAATHGASELLATSIIWAGGAALGAVALGWAPGRLLGSAMRRRGALGFVPIATLMLAPLCLPAYLVFWAWWQAWPPTSSLYRWAVESDHIHLLRLVTLYAGLVCWSWPIAAWCVAGPAASAPIEQEEMLRLDGAGSVARWRHRLRTDGRGLAVAAMIVFLIVFNETTSFDLAEVFTFGNELRVIDTMGTARDVLAAGAPAMAVAVAGAMAVWIVLGSRRRQEGGGAMRSGRPSAHAAIATTVLWCASVLLPLGLIVHNLLKQTAAEEFFLFYGRSVQHTAVLAICCAGLGALITMGLAVAWQDPRRRMRRAADVQAIGWLIAGLAPGTVVAVAHEAAYNNDALSAAIYSSPAIMVLATLARFGFVAALLGRWIAAGEPAALRDMRVLDGADSLGGQLAANWPRLLAGGAAAGAIVMALSLSEVVVTARLQPPGFDALAQGLLNALHYQRPETIVMATAIMIGASLVAAASAVIGLRIVARLARSAGSTSSPSGFVGLVALAIVAAAAAGCAQDDSKPAPLEPVRIFGTSGVSLGQFAYPRAIDADPVRHVLYVVDKTARVQRFGLDGEPQLEWRMPAWDNGKPTGISVAPDGRVFLADTHYFRVIAFDSSGNELMRFGKYGQGPGEFIFPTDIAFGPQGRLYVSEYGGNDRVQVFSPSGEPLLAFGSQGPELGQFNRPQSMVFSADMTELFITDACNHRIVVCDPQGRVLRTFGSAGVGPGQLHFPYGIARLDDGRLLVTEFGNNRIQLFSPEGRSLGVFGQVGPKPGELKYPWASAVVGDSVFVLDSGSNRVQVIRTPR